MVSGGCSIIGMTRERGQASLMMLAVVGSLLAGTLVLFAFGNALGAKGRYQRAADLAAISAAQVMRDLYRACSSRRSWSQACRTRATSSGRTTSRSLARQRCEAPGGMVCGFDRRPCASRAGASRPPE